MSMPFRTTLVLVPLVLATVALGASGPVGIYGIVERVVLEPNDNAPERLQVWGAFAYADGRSTSGLSASPARRGYLYFRLPDPGDAMRDVASREWRDLKNLAGTGQAIGFGQWGYVGAFGGLDPDKNSASPPYILELYPGHGVQTDLRVRRPSEPPARPATYQTNTGIVRLSASGNHAELVRQLREALR